MHEHQRNRRLDAARAFTESLEQLQTILTPEQTASKSEFSSDGIYSSKNQPDSQVLEEVAADLDDFFGDTQQPSHVEDVGEEH
ncbi:MAG TPA: hypothetical protein V6C91_06045 [Coleofasciculaceae cyanobacterium]